MRNLEKRCAKGKGRIFFCAWGSFPLRNAVQSAFTLVEMLMVMIVISILIIIALPAFEKIAKGSGVELAASNIAGKLKQARSYAITNRECVAVLFPQTGLKDKYMYAGYRTCIVYYDSSVYKFRRWINGEKWEFLPTGTAVAELDQDIEWVDASKGDTDSYSDNEKVDNVNCSDIGSGTVSDVVAVIFKPTGKIPDNTRYVTIGEAVYSGGALVPTTKDAATTGTSFNQIDITVDQYTGRVAYGRD